MKYVTLVAQSLHEEGQRVLNINNHGFFIVLFQVS